jgi:hypothetical protein
MKRRPYQDSRALLLYKNGPRRGNAVAKGKRRGGIYTYEVAGTKVTQTVDFHRIHQHPLGACGDRTPDNLHDCSLYYRRFALIYYSECFVSLLFNNTFIVCQIATIKQVSVANNIYPGRFHPFAAEGDGDL